MMEIKLTKRYPHSRTEDITDAYMRGWNDALDAVQNGKFIINDDRNAEPSNSEKPNNCEYAESPSGDVWECGCFLDTYCEHQIYDRNPDGTINIVECGYEPKTKPTISKMEQVETMSCQECEWYLGEDISCEPARYFVCAYEPKDEPQTERSE